MNRFTVVWTKEAIEQLAETWLVAAPLPTPSGDEKRQASGRFH